MKELFIISNIIFGFVVTSFLSVNNFTPEFITIIVNFINNNIVSIGIGIASIYVIKSFIRLPKYIKVEQDKNTKKQSQKFIEECFY